MVLFSDSLLTTRKGKYHEMEKEIGGKHRN